jgi:hypothetical protein
MEQWHNIPNTASRAQALHRSLINVATVTAVTVFSLKEKTMSKSQDSKKAVKKEPLKTPKEKKEAKKLKKEASKRQ